MGLLYLFLTFIALLLSDNLQNFSILYLSFRASQVYNI